MNLTYFVHSITEDNERGLATGWLPGKLSPEGIQRAKELSRSLQKSSFDIDAVFTSDLARATESTELFFGRNLAVFIDWRLRECNYGHMDGKPAAEFKKNNEHQYVTIPYPGGESYLDVEKRMRSFVDDLREYFDLENIAIVGHQAPQLALDVILRGMTWDDAIAQDWRRTGSWQPGWNYSIAASGLENPLPHTSP